MDSAACGDYIDLYIFHGFFVLFCSMADARLFNLDPDFIFYYAAYANSYRIQIQIFLSFIVIFDPCEKAL